MSVFEKYQGKRVDVNYETGYHFVIEYLSENELKWTALAKRAEGARVLNTLSISKFNLQPCTGYFFVKLFAF